MKLQWLDMLNHLDCTLRSYIEIVAMFISPSDWLSAERVAELCTYPKLRHFSPQEMIAYLQECAQIVQEKGIAARLTSITHCLPTHDQHKEAIALALSVVADENCLQCQHIVILYRMKNAFEFSDSDTEELLSPYSLAAR